MENCIYWGYKIEELVNILQEISHIILLTEFSWNGRSFIAFLQKLRSIKIKSTPSQF